MHQLVTWLYDRHFERAATEHRLGHVERALDAAGLHRQPPPRPAACAFADLSGSTQLTEELGDEAAADMSLRLAETMQEVADAHDGLVVKMLGDGVHFHFQDPRNAVIGSLAPQGHREARPGLSRLPREALVSFPRTPESTDPIRVSDGRDPSQNRENYWARCEMSIIG